MQQMMHQWTRCAIMSQLNACAMQVMAFRYTFITSVQLLNSFTVPCAFPHVRFDLPSPPPFPAEHCADCIAFPQVQHIADPRAIAQSICCALQVLVRAERALQAAALHGRCAVPRLAGALCVH